jgi:hypothetical protein
MNYATDYTVILTALYILIIAIAFAPKTCKVEPVEKIEYFPEVEAVEPDKKSHLVNLPVEPVTPSPAPIPQAIAPETSLHGVEPRYV